MRRGWIVLVLMFIFILKVSNSFLLCGQFDLKGILEGFVLDNETEKGIKDVEVIIVIGEGRLKGHRYRRFTDDKGYFVLRMKPIGKYYLIFRPPKPYVWGKMLKVGVKTNKITRVVTKLERSGVIILKSYDIATGRKFIPGITQENEFEVSNRIVYRWIECGKEQREIIFNCLDAGKYVFGLREPGYGYKTVEVDVGLGEKKIVEVKYDSSNKTGVYGYVKCKDGTPLKEISIGLMRYDKKGWVDMLTDNNGYYRFVDVIPGKYVLIINSKGLKGKRWKIEKRVNILKSRMMKVNFNVDCDVEYDKTLYNYKICGK